MNGYKAFGIMTIVLLLLASVFLSFGRSNEDFEKEYKKTLIGEVDLPCDKTLSQVKREGQKEPVYEWIDHPYVMADLHKDHFLVMFSYREELSTLLKIKSVTINNKDVNFVQTDGIIKSDKNSSFVVIDMGNGVLEDEGNALVVVTYEDNTLGFEKRRFIIYDHTIDEIVIDIVKMYKDYEESQTQL